MAAAMNGMALHGGIIPYSGTFLVFSDYCRPAIRLAALMGERVIHVMTHDFDRPRRRRADASAGRASRRAARDSESAGVPPCDAVETAECWQLALRSQGPAERAGADAAEPAAAAQPPRRRQHLRRRRLRDRRGRTARADVSIFATGSEVAIAVDAAKLLAGSGVAARVVSVPCFELFLEQPESVPPRHHRRCARQDRRRSRGAAGLGRHHRRRRHLRRHDALSAPARRTRNCTRISGLPPRRSPRRREETWVTVVPEAYCAVATSQRTAPGGPDMNGKPGAIP